MSASDAILFAVSAVVCRDLVVVADVETQVADVDVTVTENEHGAKDGLGENVLGNSIRISYTSWDLLALHSLIFHKRWLRSRGE